MNIGALLGIDFNVPLWLVLIVVNLVIYYMYMTWHFNYFKNLGIKGPRPIPVLGNLHQVISKGFMKFETENYEKYGKIHGIFFGRRPSLTIYDEEILKQVLVKEFPNFINRHSVKLDNNEAIFSKALTDIRGDHWKHVRSSLTPTFSAAKLRLVQAQIRDCADQLVEHIDEMVGKDEMIECKEFASCYAMDIIAYTTYGVQLDSQNDPNNKFITMNKEVLSLSFKSPKMLIFFFFPFLAKVIIRIFPLIPHKLDSFFSQLTHDVIEQRKGTTDEKLKHDVIEQSKGTTDEKKRKDFVQMMADSQVPEPTSANHPEIQVNDKGALWDRRGLTEKEIAGNSLLFLFAGYETTSATMGFILYCLTVNPECQQKLVEEIDSQLEDQDPTYDNVSQLEYLQQVIDETLRLYPPSPRLERAVEEDITINGVFMRKGTQVGIPVGALHMDPIVWPNPTKFDPERFTNEAKAERSQYYYMPFGLGPRNCIGMRLALLEIKIGIIKIMQKYTLVPCKKTEVPLKISTNENTRAENGIWVKAKRRTDIR